MSQSAKPNKDKVKSHNLGKSKKTKFIETINKTGLQNHMLKKRRNALMKKNRPQSTRKHNNFISLLFDSEKLKCPICLDLLVYPTLTTCGHSFCLHCAEDAHLNGADCVICRREIDLQQFQVSTSLKNIVLKYVLNLSSDDKQNYKMRLQNHEQKQWKRKLPLFLYNGDHVDIRTNNKWSYGVIVGISNSNSILQIYIENLKKVIEVSIHSRNVAKFLTFTGQTLKTVKNSRIRTGVSILQSTRMVLIQQSESHNAINMSNMNEINQWRMQNQLPSNNWEINQDRAQIVSFQAEPLFDGDIWSRIPMEFDGLFD